MRLRRSSEGMASPITDTVPGLVAAWDGIPAAAAHEPVIKAPRAGDLAAASTTAAPLRAA